MTTYIYIYTMYRFFVYTPATGDDVDDDRLDTRRAKYDICIRIQEVLFLRPRLQVSVVDDEIVQ